MFTKENAITELFVDGVYYSPEKDQWAVCFNRTGKVEHVSLCSWHATKQMAVLTALTKSCFRLSRVHDVDEYSMYKRRLINHIATLFSHLRDEEEINKKLKDLHSMVGYYMNINGRRRI